MSIQSTLTIAGVLVTEREGSGTVVFGENGSATGTRLFQCPWAARMNVARAIMGGVTTSEDGKLIATSSRPFSKNRDPDLFAVSCTVPPFVALAKEDNNQEIAYEFADLNVTYKLRDDFTESERNDIGKEETTGDPESSLLLTVSISSSVEVLSLADSEKGWSYRASDGTGYGAASKKDGPVKEGTINRVLTFLEWTLDYKSVGEKLDISGIRKSLRKPLHSDLRAPNPANGDGRTLVTVKGIGRVRLGTLLFSGFSASQDTIILQGAGKPTKKAWRARFRFKEHPFGWNYIFRGKPDNKSQPADSLPRLGWWPILDNITNKPPYDVSDFNKFLPDVVALGAK